MISVAARPGLSKTTISQIALTKSTPFTYRPQTTFYNQRSTPAIILLPTQEHIESTKL